MREAIITYWLGVALIATTFVFVSCQSVKLTKCEHALENIRAELDICRANQMEELADPCDL